MISLFTELKGSKPRLFFYFLFLEMAITIWLLVLKAGEQPSVLFKFLLIATMLSVFLMLFWGVIYVNQAFKITAAATLMYIYVPLIWILIFPAAYPILLFQSLPVLFIISALLLFDKNQKVYLLAIFSIFFIFVHFVYGELGVIRKPAFELASQGLLYAFTGGGIYWLLKIVENLDKQRKALEKEKNLLKRKTKALETELKISRQSTEILHKDVKKRNIEIQNILVLSDQLKMKSDTRDVLNSFLLTAIGQTAAGYALILTKEKSSQNYMKVICQKGLRGEDVKKMRLYQDSNLIEILTAIREPMLVNQIPRDTLFTDEIKMISRFEDDLICPVFSQSGLVGIIILGKKITGRPFTKEDVNLLSIIANQTAFVLEQTHVADEYKEFYTKTMRAMLHSLENRVRYSRGHNIRTANYVNLVAKRMRLSPSEVNEFTYGSLLHDIGKILVSDKYLLNSERFSKPDEPVKLKILEHTIEGSKILKSAEFNQTIIDMALHHHEFYNGRGYPHKIGENDLSLGVKILSVCNAYDAMITDRPYRRALTPEMARDVLKTQAGKQFDPEIVQVFLEELNRNSSESIPDSR